MTQNKAARLWGLVAEPKSVTFLMSLVYILLVIAGGFALKTPPATVDTVIGEDLTQIWGITLIIGGALGFIGALPGWYWLERAGLIGAVISNATYFMATVALAVASAGGDGANYITPLCLSASLTIMLIMRGERIRGITVNPVNAVADPRK